MSRDEAGRLIVMSRGARGARKAKIERDLTRAGLRAGSDARRRAETNLRARERRQAAKA